jgi:hypothetical protein
MVTSLALQTPFGACAVSIGPSALSSLVVESNGFFLAIEIEKKDPVERAARAIPLPSEVGLASYLTGAARNLPLITGEENQKILRIGWRKNRLLAFLS